MFDRYDTLKVKLLGIGQDEEGPFALLGIVKSMDGSGETWTPGGKRVHIGDEFVWRARARVSAQLERVKLDEDAARTPDTEGEGE